MPEILESLDKLPKSRDVYLWCDYIELRCLVHPDKKFSRQNLIESIDDSKGAGISAATGASDGEADENVEDGIDFEDEESAPTLEGIEGEEEEDEDAFLELPGGDKREALAADLYGGLGLRANIFADAYPFELERSNQEIRLRSSLTAPQMLYLQLLLSSSLRFVPKTRRRELTDPFELLSSDIFRGLMPDGWEVHQFGAVSSTRYTGHLAVRMDQLARDWRGEHRLARDQYATRNSGDGGLDIVAWHPLGSDDRVGIPLAAAQCGCTAEEWQLKQLEASPSHLSAKMWVLHPWNTYYFMPLDLVRSRNGTYDWQRRDKLAASIVIDRLRIVRLARQFGIDTRFGTPSAAVIEAREMSLA